MHTLISFLNTIPVEILLVVEFLLCASVLAFLVYYYHLIGIYAFIILSMIMVNIQVLKSTSLSFYPEPMALGMVVICFSFLATDLLTECYGKSIAKKGVWLGFFTNFVVVFFMLLTVGYAPAPGVFSTDMHDAIRQLFIPMPNIFLASLISYLVSQFMDITIYIKIKELFAPRLWLKSFVSTAISSIVDNAIFVFLAFYLLLPEPLAITELFRTYLVTAFVLRLLIVLCSSFLMPILRGCLLAHEEEDLTLNKKPTNYRRKSLQHSN